MHLKPILGAALTATAVLAQGQAVVPVYQFANSFSGVGYVNIENVAVRSSNNDLLLNFATGAIMTELNPDAPNPQVVVNISAVPSGPGSLTGIAEYETDKFAVGAGQFQFGPQVAGGVAGVAGSFSVWSVDLTGAQAVASQVVAIPEAGLLNGVARVPCKGNVVVIADSAVGAIWRVDIDAGTYEQVLQSSLFLPANGVNFGINGIKFGGKNLYFTNSGQGLFGVIPFSYDGYPAGDIQILANAPAGASFDDFTLAKSGNAYVAAQPSLVYKISLAGGQPVLVANSTLLAGPTSCTLRDSSLYVVTMGVGGGPMGPVSGGVFRIDVNDEAYNGGNWKGWRA